MSYFCYKFFSTYIIFNRHTIFPLASKFVMSTYEQNAWTHLNYISWEQYFFGEKNGKSAKTENVKYCYIEFLVRSE